MSFIRRLMTQKVGSSFIPFQEVFYIEGVAATITAPTGCDTANIRMWGSGGRGGRGTNVPADSTFYIGGDGGSGAYLLKVMSVSGGSSSFTCNVGIGATQTVSSTNTTISGAATLAAGRGFNGSNGGTIDDGAPGPGGTQTGGDAGSSEGEAGIGSGIQGGSAPYGGAGGLGGAATSGPGLAGGAPGGGGGGGSVNPPTEFNGGAGARGEIRIKWYKSIGSSSPIYTIYNIPLTFSATSAAPSYPTCAVQQIYSNTTRNVWDTGGAILRSVSFVRSFTANTGAGTCDFNSAASSLTIRIKSNSNVQLPQDYFTSLFTTSGAQFNSADAFWSFDTSSPLGNGLYDTIWYWYGVSDSIFTTGTNLNVRFKV